MASEPRDTLLLLLLAADAGLLLAAAAAAKYCRCRSCRDGFSRGVHGMQRDRLGAAASTSEQLQRLSWYNQSMNDGDVDDDDG